MKKSLILIFILLLIIILPFACEDSGDDDDDDDTTTYAATLTLTDATAYNTQPFLVAVFEHLDDPNTDSPVGSGSDTIDSIGTASVSVNLEPGDYDVYAFIDENGDQQPTGGEMYWDTGPGVNDYMEVIDQDVDHSITISDMSAF